MKQQNGVAPYKLPIINEEGSVLREEKDPIRLACLYTLSFVRTGRCTDKDQWAYWSTLWPVRYTEEHGYQRVLPVWIEIEGEDKTYFPSSEGYKSPKDAICVAKMTPEQAKRCGLATVTYDEDGEKSVEVKSEELVGGEMLWIPCKYFQDAASALGFHKSLPVLKNDANEMRLERGDGDDLFADLGWIKPHEAQDWKYVYAATAFLGVKFKESDHIFAAVQGDREDAHPVWWALNDVAERRIHHWGDLKNGRDAGEEIYKLKLKFVNHLRTLADWFRVGGHVSLMEIAAEHTAGFPFLDFGEVAKAVSDGFGSYGDTEKSKEKWKGVVNELFELAELSKELDFAAELARIESVVEDKGEAILKAFLRGDITPETLFELSSQYSGKPSGVRRKVRQRIGAARYREAKDRLAKKQQEILRLLREVSDADETSG